MNQREDLQRSLLSACGSRVVRRAKKQGSITRAEIAALIEGLSVGPFWSRSRVRVQSGEKGGPSSSSRPRAAAPPPPPRGRPYRGKKGKQLKNHPGSEQAQ